MRVRTALVILAFGLALFFGGALAFGVAGGIPYPDGPYAGFVSPPGPRRWLETAAPYAFFGGAGIFFVGLGHLTIICVARIWRRTKPA